jgi:hypothetical protein
MGGPRRNTRPAYNRASWWLVVNCQLGVVNCARRVAGARPPACSSCLCLSLSLSRTTTARGATRPKTARCCVAFTGEHIVDNMSHTQHKVSNIQGPDRTGMGFKGHSKAAPRVFYK